MTRRDLKRAALGIATAVVALGVVIHVPPIRGWLAAHGHHGGGVCPLGYGRSPEAKHAAAVALRGTTPARERPALGFQLDRTTVADVMAWAGDHHVGCTSQHGGTVVECSRLPAELVPGALAITSAWLRFGANGTLDAITTTRRDSSAGPVAAAFTAVQDDVTRRAGSPSRHDGSAAPEILSNAGLRQAMVEYRFTDYHAVVRATNMGDGYVLTEEYATLVD